MNKEERDKLLKEHITGATGLFKLSGGFKGIFWSRVGKAALFISIVAVLLALILDLDLYQYIIEVDTLLINFLPGILGFTIAGFTLMVGFLQSNLIESITIEREGEDYTLYQTIVSTFGMGVLLQALALMVAYFLHFVIYYGQHFSIFLPSHVEKFINLAGLTVIFYSFSLSLFIVSEVIIGIFNFSQLHHFVVVTRRKQEEQKKQKEQKERTEKEG